MSSEKSTPPAASAPRLPTANHTHPEETSWTGVSEYNYSKPPSPVNPSASPFFSRTARLLADKGGMSREEIREECAKWTAAERDDFLLEVTGKSALPRESYRTSTTQTKNLKIMINGQPDSTLELTTLPTQKLPRLHRHRFARSNTCQQWPPIWISTIRSLNPRQSSVHSEV